MEGVMKKFVFSLLAAVAVTGAFIAEAVAAFPPNDWHTAGKSRLEKKTAAGAQAAATPTFEFGGE
jgi:hypothetical protein